MVDGAYNNNKQVSAKELIETIKAKELNADKIDTENERNELANALSNYSGAEKELIQKEINFYDQSIRTQNNGNVVVNHGKVVGSGNNNGLAFDINSASSSFNDTPEAKWIAANCWKYGFVLRYPQGKENITGYMYESWHVRYLGKDWAKKIYDSGLTLEEYFGITSQYAA